MSQYERIVSYIYRYNHGKKGANVGFAKIEKRGNICRISVQMRAVPVSKAPQVYLFQQFDDGIRTVCIGTMSVRGSDLLCKASSDAEKLFQSEYSIDDMEGIFIDIEEDVCFATSWKNDTFYLGNWNKNIDGKFPEVKESTTDENKLMAASKSEVDLETELQENSKETVMQSQEMQKKIVEKEYVSRKEIDEEEYIPKKEIIQIQEDNLEKEAETDRKEQGQKDIQMQSICGVCPFKRKAFDYGKKILMTFPSMKPFETGVAKACVRMELQDIGCLPIASWSLSGNRFLLHGYYCYRHLIFAQLEDDQYVLGVPGIYSDKEKNNAIRFGFSKFQSIGPFNQKQGAFGYWMLTLPESDDSDFFK